MIKVLLQNIINTRKVRLILNLNDLRNNFLIKSLFLHSLSLIIKHLLIFKIKLKWRILTSFFNNLRYLDIFSILESLTQLLYIATLKVLIKLYLGSTWAYNNFWLYDTLKTVLVAYDTS